jgi:hypothetical protein
MTTGRSLRLGTISVAAAFCLASGLAHALDCPEPQPQGEPGVLEETRQDIATWSATLAGDDLLNRIDELATRLRAKHPDVDEAELVNYLVTAYCPVVAQMDGLSEAEKTARLDQFSEQAFTAVSR